MKPLANESCASCFGQALVTEDLERAFQAARQCDVLLAVGSTLSVFPIAGVSPRPRRPSIDPIDRSIARSDRSMRSIG